MKPQDAREGNEAVEHGTPTTVSQKLPAVTDAKEEEKWTFDRDQPVGRRDRRIYAWPRHIGNATSTSDARAICDEHNASIQRVLQKKEAVADSVEVQPDSGEQGDVSGPRDVQGQMDRMRSEMQDMNDRWARLHKELGTLPDDDWYNAPFTYIEKLNRKRDIGELVNRFLAWPLPPSVCSDPCVTKFRYDGSRCGTNLLTADEARQMIEHLLLSEQAPKSSTGSEFPKEVLETGGRNALNLQMALKWLNGADHRNRSCHQPFGSGWTPCVCGLHDARYAVEKCLSENGPKSDAVMGVSLERKEGDASLRIQNRFTSNAAPVVQSDSVAANPPSPSPANAQPMARLEKAFIFLRDTGAFFERCNSTGMWQVIDKSGKVLGANDSSIVAVEQAALAPSLIKEQPAKQEGGE